MLHDFLGIRYRAAPGVYAPSDDTALLLDAIFALPPAAGARVLEIGCGAGLPAIACAKLGARVVASDVNPAAVALARANARENSATVSGVVGDLLSWLKGRFDRVLFNAPYLPSEPSSPAHPDERALLGGALGGELLERFFATLPQHLAPGGLALVVASTRTGGPWRQVADEHGLELSPVASRALPFETLTAWRVALGRQGARDDPDAT